MRLIIGFLSLVLMLSVAQARTVQVFVALCDNKSQGIVPVPAKIGDGDKPADNLYWGCTDGLLSVFSQSKQWKLVKREKNVSPEILERVVFQHVSADVTLTANAYRGSEIKRCLQDFEVAAATGETDLAVYIGHNGLMDFQLPLTDLASKKQPAEAIVLCCKSNPYFAARLKSRGVRPILLTEQFMYPGAFILRDSLDPWMKKESLTAIRAAAGAAYAKNQKISVKAGTGVFSKL